MTFLRLTGWLAVLLPLGAVQAQIIASETFDTCAPGSLSCSGWSGNGAIEDLRGDHILVFPAVPNQALTATWRPHTEYSLTAGRMYRASVVIRTDSLAADFVVVARLRGNEEEELRMEAVRETSSWHRMEGTFRPSANGSLEMRFSLIADESKCELDSGLCGAAYVDDIMIAESPVEQEQNRFANVCPEGKYADLAHSENDCEDLHVALGDLGFRVRDTLALRRRVDVDTVFAGDRSARLGFDPVIFRSGFSLHEDNRLEVDHCDAASVQAAIETVKREGGGVVRMPRCLLLLESPILIENAGNIILEGHGIGRTILERVPTPRSWPAVRVVRSRNVVVRDLSLRLNRLPQANINLDFSTNVLIERILISHAGSASIRSNHTTRHTVRYSVILYGPKAFNDGGCQGNWFRSNRPRRDDLDGDGKGSTLECEKKWQFQSAPGSTWSASYAAYSNITFENGFSLHLDLIEIAGNRFVRSTGNKISDGWFAWIHDNEFRENRSTSSRVATFRTNSDGIVDRTTSRVLLYRNRFVDLINPAARMMGREEFVIDNSYRMDLSRLREQDRIPLKLGRFVSICEGTEEHDFMLNGDLRRNIPRLLESRPGGHCDLRSPGTFWTDGAVSSGAQPIER